MAGDQVNIDSVALQVISMGSVAFGGDKLIFVDSVAGYRFNIDSVVLQVISMVLVGFSSGASFRNGYSEPLHL